MEYEYRFYFDENGDFLGAIYDFDPVPPGWTTYTLLVPNSWETGSNPPLEKWSFTRNNWYLPYTEEKVAEHRDMMIEVIVTYDNGEKVLTVMNDERTRSALLRVKSDLEARPASTLYFQTFDSDEYLGLSDITGLFIASREREQKCFDAFKAVRDEHAINPFEATEDAIYFFNNQI